MIDALRTITHSRWAWLVSGCVLGLVLAGSGLTAQAPPAVAGATHDSMTVFIGVHGGKSTAKDINKVCKSYAPAGWSFADMEPNVENGDQKGVWVTFVKPASQE